MKKEFYFLILAICLNFQTNAQPKKGDLLIGSSTNVIGSLSSIFSGSIIPEGQTSNAAIQYGTYKSKVESGSITLDSKTTMTAFNLAPNIGFFVSNKVLLGTSLGFSHLVIKDDNDEKDKLTIFSFTPHARFYFLDTGRSLPYFEAKGGFVYAKGNEDDDSETVPLLAAKAGYSFFIGPKISLDVYGEYNYSWREEELSSATIKESRGFFGLGLGLSIFLDRNKNSDE